MVSVFDVVIGQGFYHQLRSTQFETTRGKVLTSQVIVEQGDESTIYRPKVTYENSVNNETLHGDMVSYGEIAIGDSSAKCFVADHPVGKIIDVHFDPANASDAVLVTGIQGADLFILMFMTPFNVVMVGGWYILGRLAFGSIIPTAFGRPCRFSDDGYEMRIMINRISPFAVFGICLLATSFANTFVVGIGAAIISGALPSLPVMLVVWTFNLSLSGLVTNRYALRNWSGHYDIVVRQLEKKVTLPVNDKRKKEVTLSFKEIEEVFIDKNTNIDFGGDEQHSFRVNLRLVPHSKSSIANRKNIELLKSFHGEEEARAYRFANWFVTDVLNRPLPSDQSN